MGILKFFSSIFGLNSWKETESADELKDSANDLAETLTGKRHVFGQTRKDREKYDFELQEQMRESMRQQAENSEKLTLALEELTRQMTNKEK